MCPVKAIVCRVIPPSKRGTTNNTTLPCLQLHGISHCGCHHQLHQHCCFRPGPHSRFHAMQRICTMSKRSRSNSTPPSTSRHRHHQTHWPLEIRRYVTIPPHPSLPTNAELLSIDAFHRNIHSHPQPPCTHVMRAPHITFYHCDATPHNYLPSLPFPTFLSWPMADYGIPTLGLGLGSHPGAQRCGFSSKVSLFCQH